jgi:hypothetical protein
MDATMGDFFNGFIMATIKGTRKARFQCVCRELWVSMKVTALIENYRSLAWIVVNPDYCLECEFDEFDNFSNELSNAAAFQFKGFPTREPFDEDGDAEYTEFLINISVVQMKDAVVNYIGTPRMKALLEEHLDVHFVKRLADKYDEDFVNRDAFVWANEAEVVINTLIEALNLIDELEFDHKWLIH